MWRAKAHHHALWQKNWISDNITVKLDSDKEALAACKSFVLENSRVIVEKSIGEDLPELDPMTPPIVRLSQVSAADDGHYAL